MAQKKQRGARRIKFGSAPPCVKNKMRQGMSRNAAFHACNPDLKKNKTTASLIEATQHKSKPRRPKGKRGTSVFPFMSQAELDREARAKKKKNK